MKYQNVNIVDLAATSSYFFSEIESLAHELNEFDLMTKNLDVISKSTSEWDEYEIYILQNSIQISGSAFDWWLHDEQWESWSWLSQMTIDILSIPAMSTEPEQVFSETQRTISWDRMQLEQEIIEKIECLKSWMHHNIAVGTLNIELDEALNDQID